MLLLPILDKTCKHGLKIYKLFYVRAFICELAGLEQQFF